MKPTIGRIIIYKLTEEQQDAFLMDMLPCIITSVNQNETINMNLFTEGDGLLYIPNVEQGDEPGQWNWPKIEK